VEGDSYKNMTPKVVFLYIDGVLNNHSRVINFYCGIHPELVQRLNQITDATDASIVISSAWRYMVYGGAMTLRGLCYLFATHGIKAPIIDITQRDEEVPQREEQIAEYIIKHGIQQYVVLDDLPLQIPNFVKTEGNVGLTDTHVKQAIEILTKC
jgi:hypothetical protein